MTGLERAVRDAGLVTAVHEEALRSLDHREDGYDELRKATAHKVLFELSLREVAEVEAQVEWTSAEASPQPLLVVA